jgi:WD40 repeat protein
VHDLASKTQKFFRHHTEFVSAFAMFPRQADNLVASAQDGVNPRICIWNSATMQLISVLEGNDPSKLTLLAGARVFPSYLEAGVQSMSFSRDGRQLIALAGDADCSMVIHECTSKSTESKWTFSKCVASAKAGGTRGEKALNVTFSPFSNTILTAGVKHMKFWEVHPQGEMLARAGIFASEDTSEIHLCAAYLDAETCVTGTATGMIWIWKNIRVMQVIAWAHQGPIFDLAVDGRMLVSSGQDMKLCFWNLHKDFRVVPPGKIDRGEMLVKQLHIADTVRRGNPESASRWLERIGVGCVRALAWSSNQVFVGTGFNHIFVVNDIEHSARLIVSGHHRGGMTGVCSHPKLPLILSAGREGTILVRNSVTKETLLARNLEVDRGTRKKPKAVDVSVSKHKTKVVKPKKSEKQVLIPEEETEGHLLEHNQDDEEMEESDHEDHVPEHRKKKAPDWPVQLTCIDVCVHGAHVAVGQDDGGFTVLSLEYDAQGELIFDDLFAVIPKTPKDPVTCIKISPSVAFIAVGFSRGYIKVYQTSNLQKKTVGYVVCRGFYGEVTRIDWEDKSRCIRVNDSFNDLKTFDVRSGSEIDYFGSMYSVKLKRLRFCPEHQRSSEHENVDFEKYPEAKVIGFGVTRHRPYLVTCISSLVDASGIPEFATGYSNEQIQVGDRIIEIGSLPTENLGLDSLRQALYGLPCKPECDPHNCAHSTVEIVFTRNRPSNLGLGPGGVKIYNTDQISVSQCGPYHLEGRWTSCSCPLTWASHRLYLDKYIPGEVLSTAISAKQKLMAIGDTYGQVTIMGYPADPETIVNKDGQKMFCAIDYVIFTAKDRHLLVGNELHSILMQWKPLLVKEAKRVAQQRTIKLPARTPDGITNLHLRLLLDRPFASESTGQVYAQRKPTAEDGFDAQMQWWQNAVPDSVQREGKDAAQCDRELVLDHVYGYNGREGRHNVFELMNGDLLFPVGCLCVLSRPVGSTPTEITQYFFRGHTDFVVALAVHPNGRIIASGDCGARPLICVWDVESSDWINRSLSACLASIRGFHKNGISALAFSSDGEHLASVGEDTNNSIAVFEWQKDSLLPYAVCTSGQNRVLCCTFNPYAFEVVTCGVKHVSFWAFDQNPGAKIEQQIAVESVKQHAAKDPRDVWLELLLDRDPAAVAKMCPASIVNRSFGLSDQFMEWAIHDHECSDSYTAAKSLGESCIASTNVCAVYIDRETAVTGAADGKILVWNNNKLTSFVDAHSGPIFDIDCPKNRGNFYGDMMISNVKNQKHFVRVAVRGAATEDVMNKVAKEALEDWHKEFERNAVQKRDPPQIKNALIRWEASDAQEFVTCGQDGMVKQWGMRQMLVVGPSTYDLTDLFEQFCTAFRGGHKFRSKTVTYEEFISCLSHLQLLYETEHLNDGEHAYETTKSSDHIRLSKAEAKRIFRDQNVPEMCYGDFASCIERIFNLLGVRGEADHLQMINLREQLNEDLVRLVAGQQNDPNGAFADTFDYRILKTKEDIQRIDALLRKGRISMYGSLKSFRAVRLEPSNMEERRPDVDCLRSVYFKTGNIIVGTSSNSIYVFNMQTGKWNARVSGHDGRQISSICTCPTNVDVIASGGQDAYLILWSGKAKSAQTRRKFPSAVEAVDFSPSAKDTLAVGLTSGDVFILDVSKGSLTQHLAEIHVSDSVSVVRFSQDGRWIAVGYHSATIRLFDICYDSVESPGRFKLQQHPHVFYGHQGPVTSLDWSADSKFIQSASRLAGELLYWSVHNGQQMRGLTVSDIKNLKWSTSTSIFGWHMHGPHKHISMQVKLINKDVEPLIGQRVSQASASSSRVSECFQQVGTVIRISKDKRCDVRWDTNMVEGNVGVGNHKNQKIDIGYGGDPKFDLALAENSIDIREIASTDMSNVIDKFNPAFVATGDNGGFVQLMPLGPPSTTGDANVVHQQLAHPGGTHLVKLSGNDRSMYTTGILDHSIFHWICRPRQDLLFSIADVLRTCASMGVREFFGGLALLADDLFPESTLVSIRKRDRVKDILDEVKEGLSFGPRDVVGLTISLEDEGESVPKSSSEEARKEKAIKHDISEAVGILKSRIDYCGWERASNDPADHTFRFSNVHLNLSAAEFEGFGKISSAELFADQIIEQIRDPQSKIRNSMTTRLAVRAMKQRAFEMIPPLPPTPERKRVKGRTVRACEYPGCEGAIVEIDERKAQIRPAGDLGFQASKTASFDFRFRRMRSRIFDPIIRTSVTNVNALQPSKAPKPLYRAKKPDLTHQQLVTIFQILDYGDRGWISHADFMTGLRRNPDFAGLLGVPTIDLQKVASRHIYERRYGDEGLDSSGIDASKKMDMEEFVSFFGKIQRQTKPLESIENANWTISTNAMKPPSLCDAILSIKGSKPPTRRWNHKITSHSVLPVMSKQEALEIFNELGLGENDSITQAEFVKLLQRSQYLEDKLGRKKIKAEELAAFFSDIGIWNPYLEKTVKKPTVPIGVAFQAFQKLDEEGQGWIMIGSFVTGLKQYPGIADSLGLLSRSMRTDALSQIYEYIYRTKPAIASRKIDLAEFVYVFSNCSLGEKIPLHCLSTTK